MYINVIEFLSICLNPLNINVTVNELTRMEFDEDIAICNQIAMQTNIESINEETFIVTDLAGNEFYIKTGEERGFMAYDPVSNSFLEKSSELISPFDFESESEYFYFGPMNYYRKIGGSYYSIYDDVYVSEKYIEELQIIFDKQLEDFRNYNNSIATSINEIEDSNSTLNSNKTYIDNYEFIKYAVHPNNNNNSCGFVAATLVLNYWENTMFKGTILPQFLDENGNLNKTEEINPSINLKDKLVEFNNNVGESWGMVVRDSLLKYAQYANLSCYSAYYLFNFNLKDELIKNHPVILFGSLPTDPNAKGKMDHAVTAYGLDNNNPIVNYGWGPEKSEVTLSSGFIASITTFELRGYEENVIITPNDYTFDGSYNQTEVKTSHHINGLNFDTSRLRTGFIESEYITMSPRKEGFGTAYIKYDFEQPIIRMDVDLTFWSDDERYNVIENPTAAIYYKSLYGDEWINTADLLNLNLPTDRTNPSTYTFEFVKKTKSIVFYTNFKYMTGWIDRNKGRICIGDMIVHTFFDSILCEKYNENMIDKNTVL